MPNPILIEVTRAARVESYHTGAIAISTPDGRLLLSLGNVTRPVYARSAIKSLQCLPLIELGAADRFGFGPAEIALACALTPAPSAIRPLRDTCCRQWGFPSRH